MRHDATVAARVLHVTDPHLFADAEGELRGTRTDASLRAVIDHFVRSGWPADIVAVTGDIIQDDSAAAYDRFRDILTSIGLPVHCVPGNHDVRPLMREALDSPPYHYCQSVRLDNWLVTGIDSCIDNDAGGRISDEELLRLRGILETTDAEHVAVCLHHPPLPLGSRWLDTVGLYNGEAFLDLVAGAGNVRAALFGHVHQPFDVDHRSVRVIGTPSTCAQFLPRSDDFAVDDRPPAYRRITLVKDGSLDAELVWLDS